MGAIRMAKSHTGDVNRNGQRLLGKTTMAGTDYMQHVWIVQCTQPNCGFRYGANSSDFFQRLCPRCQRGKRGLPIGGLA
jgi:hypothetical protein